MSNTLTAKKKWFEWLQAHCIGSSGKGASLLGMRRSFWGNDAFVVRCCGYLFNVSATDFNLLRNIL